MIYAFRMYLDGEEIGPFESTKSALEWIYDMAPDGASIRKEKFYTKRPIDIQVTVTPMGEKPKVYRIVEVAF